MTRIYVATENVVKSFLQPAPDEYHTIPSSNSSHSLLSLQNLDLNIGRHPVFLTIFMHAVLYNEHNPNYIHSMFGECLHHNTNRYITLRHIDK